MTTFRVFLVGCMAAPLISFVSLAAKHSSLPSARDGIAKVHTWNANRIKSAESKFKSSGSPRFSSPEFWGDEIVYQIQVDRFNNGDPSNDGINLEQFQRDHQNTTQQGLPHYRHGGDLQGIIDRLPYLSRFGVTTLWLTSIFKNNNGSYHGYCTSDFTEIDPGFGSTNKLVELVKKAHSQGIKIVLDVVVNHICDRETQYDDQATPFNSSDYDSCIQSHSDRYWKGTSTLSGQREIKLGSNFFPPLDDPRFLTRCGHRSGDFASHGNGSLFGDFTESMLDLDTQHTDFQRIFTDLHKYWIAVADVDGFRVDAAKHVTGDFLAYFSTQVREYARNLGKDNFFLIGEIASNTWEQAHRLGHMNPGGAAPKGLVDRKHSLKTVFSQHPHWKRPGLNAVYDFTYSGLLTKVWRIERAAPAPEQSKTPLNLKNWIFQGNGSESSNFNRDFVRLERSGDPRLNWNLLEIHDWYRFALWGASVQKMIGAGGHLIMSQGVPIIYYGFEQGLNGRCPPSNSIQLKSMTAETEVKDVCYDESIHNHSRYRQDMFLAGPWRLGSQIPEIDRLAGIGTAGTSQGSADPYLREDHDLYKSLKKFIEIRKSCSALRRGKVYFRAADGWNGGMMAFSRIHADKEILVLVNTGARSIPVQDMIVDAGINPTGVNWRNLLNGFESGHTERDPNGGLRLSFDKGFYLRPHSLAIFAPVVDTTQYQPQLGAHLCTE